jgi:hypothetical protein
MEREKLFSIDLELKIEDFVILMKIKFLFC